MLLASSAQAVVIPSPTPPVQPLFGFEAGVDGWVVPGFTLRPVTLTTSTLGATEGWQALAITQTGEGYNWVAHRTSQDTAIDAFYNAMNFVSIDESPWSLDFDVTFLDRDIPDGNFLNLAVWINSDNGFLAVQDVARTFTEDNATVHVSIPLISFPGTDPLATNSSFYELGLIMNGDWGPSDARVYVDNIQLIPEPSGIWFGLALLGVLLPARYRKLR